MSFRLVPKSATLNDLEVWFILLYLIQPLGTKKSLSELLAKSRVDTLLKFSNTGSQ